MILKILFILLIFILEIPLAIKFRIALSEYNFSKQAAIIVLMILAVFFVVGIYKLSLFMLGLV